MADDQVQVQVRFTVEEEGYPTFSDALYVPLDEYDDLVASGEIERMKRERWEAWASEVFPEADTPPLTE